MASCITSQFGNNYCPQVRLTVTESSSATTSTLAWTLEYVAHGFAASTSTAKSYTAVVAGETVASGTYSINGKTGTYTIASGTKVINKTTSSQSISFSCSMAFNLTWSGTYGGTKSASGSITIGAIASYTISYNANGGSGAPGAQTKWAGTNLTLSATRPTKPGYSCLGWSTSSTATSAAYAAGAPYTANASATLYAVWKANTYTVSYNANGGAGAPGNQTKTYGVTLKLSATKPTRTNYNFLGWGTSASSTTVAYAAGANYTENTGITLYAIWQLAYTKPRISTFTADRCTSAGTASETGTYARVKFTWATDRTVSSIKIEWKTSTATSWSSTTVSASGTSGTVNQIVGSGGLNAEYEYNIQVTVVDSGGNTSEIRNVSPMSFPIDVRHDGKGVSFGKPSTSAGVDSAWPIYEQGKRVYSPNNKPTTADIGAIKGVLANSYYGLAWPDGNVGNWVRTTENGLLPYQPGGASNIGANGWPFTGGYFNALYCKGRKVVDFGSAANKGYYIRLYDGTQICWYSWPVTITTNQVFGNLYYAYGGGFTFPVAFANSDISVTMTIQDNDMTAVATYGVTAADVDNTYIYCGVNKTKTVRLHYIAIGRWE